MEKKKDNIDLLSPGFINEDDIILNGRGSMHVSQDGYDITSIGLGDSNQDPGDILVDRRENPTKYK